MKRHLIFVAILILISVTQSWGGQFGPITSRVNPGQFYLGGGYMWLSEEFDPGNFSNNNDTLETRQNSLYLQGGVGLGNRWEAYIRGGVADFSADEVYQFLGDDDSSNDLRPFVTAGIGGPVFVGKNLTVGPFLQASYYSDYEDEQRGSYASLDGKEKILFDNAIAIDLGLTFEVTIEGAALYAGPIYSYYDSEIKSVFTADNGLGVATKGWEDLELDSSFGGFVGINWPLTEKLQLSLEGQYRSGLGIGGTLLYAF